MCFSLIEMHFNVVQISFLQLQSKLATCLRVCVRARSVTRAYAIYMSVCTYVRHARALWRKREGKRQRKSIPTVESVSSVGLHKQPSDASRSHKLTVLVRNK